MRIIFLARGMNLESSDPQQEEGHESKGSDRAEDEGSHWS